MPRRFLTAGALTMLLLSASPATAAEAPIVTGCSATVVDDPGRQVVLDPATLTAPITEALTRLDPLGLLAGQFRTAWTGTDPIPVGTIPDGQTEVSGSRIADAVTTRLGQIPLLGQVLAPLTSTVDQTLGSLCGIVLRGVPRLPTGGAAPTPEPAPAPAGAPTAPAGRGNPATAPNTAQQHDSASDGGAVFGTPLPIATFFPLTGTGIPGAAAPLAGTQPAAMVSVPQSGGSATVLPTTRRVVPVPMLTALLLLSVVSALLVRRWVLGKH